MIMTFMKKNELILKGTINLLILTEIIKNPMYGYAIERKINSIINSKLPTGTIYTLLHSLENKNYIKCSEKKNANGRMSKIYEITDTGKTFLEFHVEPLNSVSGIVNYLIEEIPKVCGTKK